MTTSPLASRPSAAALPPPESRFERFARALDAKAPALSFLLAPLGVGYLAATDDDFLGKNTFRDKWGPVGGGLATFGAKVAVGVGAGVLTAVILAGGLIELGVETARGKKPLG